MKLQQVRRIAMAMPSVTEEPHFHYTSFRVAGKIFATAPPDGDFLHVFVDEEQRQLAMALDPEPLSILTWGKAVVGLRVDLSKAKAALVKKLLQQSWGRKGPKKRAVEVGAFPRARSKATKEIANRTQATGPPKRNSRAKK
jgi:hypothetical protein